MSNYYKTIATPVLERMWERERDRLSRKVDAVVGDYEDLFAMRRELDRRRGIENPSSSVNYENYVSD